MKQVSKIKTWNFLNSESSLSIIGLGEFWEHSEGKIGHWKGRRIENVDNQESWWSWCRDTLCQGQQWWVVGMIPANWHSLMSWGLWITLVRKSATMSCVSGVGIDMNLARPVLICPSCWSSVQRHDDTNLCSCCNRSTCRIDRVDADDSSLKSGGCCPLCCDVAVA